MCEDDLLPSSGARFTRMPEHVEVTKNNLEPFKVLHLLSFLLFSSLRCVWLLPALLELSLPVTMRSQSAFSFGMLEVFQLFKADKQ